MKNRQRLNSSGCKFTWIKTGNGLQINIVAQYPLEKDERPAGGVNAINWHPVLSWTILDAVTATGILERLKQLECLTPSSKPLIIGVSEAKTKFNLEFSKKMSPSNNRWSIILTYGFESFRVFEEELKELKKALHSCFKIPIAQ